MHVCVIRRGYESLRRGPAAARGRPGPFCPVPVLSRARFVPCPSCPTPVLSHAHCIPGPLLVQPGPFVPCPFCPLPVLSLARFVPCPFCPGSFCLEPVVLPSLLSRSPVFPSSPQHRRARSSPARARERFLNRICFVAVIFLTAIVISLYYYIILFL